MIQGLDNIGICTTEVARSVAFYQRFLGGIPERPRGDDDCRQCIKLGAQKTIFQLAARILTEVSVAD